MARARPLRRTSSSAPSVVTDVVRSAGAPLDRTTRAVMGAAFGRDFSGVRVHTDEKAARSATAVNANAYTVGQHIAFGQGNYRPNEPGGQALLAHELAHVVQGGGGGVLRRQACGHDGRAPRCGGYRWGLINMATGETTNEDLDNRIVHKGLQGNFGGTWATQVQTPPNTVKGGKQRGRLDGLRVRSSGGLLVEVVEVKSRATQFKGGCAVATGEATEYVRLLNGLAAHVVTISTVLSAHPELRTAKAPNAAQRRQLAANGVDLGNQKVKEAWNFFRSLEDQLGRQFSQPFSSFSAVLNRDGAPGASYVAGERILVDCRRRGKKGVKYRQLLFQVNGAGGVSYGCEDTECKVEEEEKKKKEQRQQQEQRVPVAADDQQRQPQATDLTVPVLVGTGAAAVAVGTAAARRRAAQIAARRLAAEAAAREAERRAAQAAWRKAAEAAAEKRAARAAAAGAGKRVAGKAIGKAVIYVEAAAAVLVLLSGEAKAEIGPGQSSLEALYQIMTRNGTPPSPEMRELIENDPVLRQLAEQAAQTGDASGLQGELDRQSLEFLRDHAHELSDEELEILLSSTNARGAGGSPPASVEELKTAIAAERERRRTGAPAARPGATAGSGSGPGKAAETPGGQGGPAGGPTPAEPERHPQLSQEVRAELAAAPPDKRRVVEALISGRDGGPPVTDDSTRRILAAVPGDLTAEQADRLLKQVGPATGKSVDEIVESVTRAVAAVRAGKDAEADGAETTTEPGAQQTPEEARAARDEYIRSIIAYIDGYTGWAQVAAGRGFIRPIDKTTALRTVPLGTTFDVIMFGRESGDSPLRYAGTGRAAVTARTARTVTIEVRSAVTVVRENRSTLTIPAGRTFENSVLVGRR